MPGGTLMLDPGTVIGGYRIEQFVASGGMGAVYRATQLSLERIVALKLLSGHLSDDPAFRKRFRREAVLQATLEHPNIVPVYEAGESVHGLYIAMRFVNGPDLKELIGELDRRRALRLLAGVASALDAAHAAGLIHRDIKPQNILVFGGEHAHLADFGLTTATGLSSVTQAGQFLGTLDYVSPEQIQDEELDARSDVYSLGAVLYECMTGVVPFPRASKVGVIYAHLEQAPRPACELAPELPPELDAVLARALAKPREERFASAGELIRAAATALEGAGTIEARPARVAGHAEAQTGKETTTEEVGGPAAAAGGAVAAGGPTAGGEARPAQRAGGWRGRVAFVAVLAACALVGVLGYIAGHSGADAGPAGPTRALSADGVTARIPASWRRRTVTLPEIFSGPFAAAGPSSPGSIEAAEVAVGRTKGFGPSLVPQALRNRVPNVPAIGAAVQVRGGAQGRLYRVTGPRRYEILFAPALFVPGAVAVVACVGPPRGPDGGVFSACDRVLGSLQVAHPFPLDPRPEYARFLNSVLGTLGKRASAELMAYRAARDANAQARAAGELAVAFASARVAFQGLIGHGLSPSEFGTHVSIRDKLAAVSLAYRHLSSAARSRAEHSYTAAQSEVGGATLDLSSHIDELVRGGYSLS